MFTSFSLPIFGGWLIRWNVLLPELFKGTHSILYQWNRFLTNLRNPFDSIDIKSLSRVKIFWKYVRNLMMRVFQMAWKLCKSDGNQIIIRRQNVRQFASFNHRLYFLFRWNNIFFESKSYQPSFLRYCNYLLEQNVNAVARNVTRFAELLSSLPLKWKEMRPFLE